MGSGMKIAYYSPLPPAKTGIADYSAALLDPLSRRADLQVISRAAHREGGESEADAALFQLGNNPYHDFVYRAAINKASDRPNIAVFHEANLHHLIVHLTLARGDAKSYWQEVERNGGSRGCQPDYSNPLLHSILERSDAAIVHSTFVENQLRAAGFSGPIARIPHGAWIPDLSCVESERRKFRALLGMEEAAPLFGIFGFLKPYKRIAQALRAFRKVVRQIPAARLILVGERHPDLAFDLPPEARHIDFACIEDFNGYIAACDALINLRYPTVGETSGTLMRAFGMGRASIVSDAGSFAEFPDSTCIKVPVDPKEEEYLFEYMRLLAIEPELRGSLGRLARDWATTHCSWDSVAAAYGRFVDQVSNKGLRNWTDPRDRYVRTHQTRLEKTHAITPRGTSADRVLEMGAYLQITPALQAELGYGEVRGCYYGPLGRADRRTVRSREGVEFACEIDHFDAESDPFPYSDASFATVLCCELLEHLSRDPMHMMAEIHRILRPGGHLVLTTPNLASLRAVGAVLQGGHPMLFPSYIRSTDEARHAREYTPREIHRLLEQSGFTVELLETGPFRQEPQPEAAWVERLLDRHALPQQHRGEGIYAVGRKTGEIQERFPDWLYS